MRGWFAIIGPFMVAGCIESSLVPCGAQLCPVRSTCVADACVDNSDLEACADLADGDACASKNVAAGVCRGGACFPRGCGNGIVEPGEACDDGNREFGDGCSADCMSTETCGNGVLDFSEECEDGGLMSGDGCSSTCRREQLTWSYLPTPQPTGLTVATAAFDVRRQRMIVTGARPGQARETWAMDRAGAWTMLVGAATPQPVLGAPMVYDPDRDRMVALGGIPAQTWVFDGTQWRALPTTPPPARSGHALTYDRTNQRVLMFGGVAGGTARNDTWVLEGDLWRELLPPIRPDARYDTWLVYDPVHSTAVLTGGTPGDAFLTDAWLFDGATWHETPAPLARLQAQLVFDSARRRVVFLNGNEILGGFTPTVTELTGTHWESFSVNDRLTGVATYDPFRRGILSPGDSVTGPRVTGILRWIAPNEELESCSGLDDLDRDGLVGCADPDCFGYCDPLCPPGATCPATRPRCGDGTCDVDWETHARCPADCP